MTDNEVKLWLVVAIVAAVASAFRCLRNGQWKDWKHTLGVVGCGMVGSWCITAFVYFMSDTVKANLPIVIGVAGGSALLGKDFHERFISGVLDRISDSRKLNNADAKAKE